MSTLNGQRCPVPWVRVHVLYASPSHLLQSFMPWRIVRLNTFFPIPHH